MSTVILDTITGKSTATTITIGSTPVVSASANSMTIRGEGSAQTSIQQGLAKCWVNFNGAAGTLSARDSFNVSTITDNSTGNYSPTFSNNMNNSDYSTSSTGNADYTASGYGIYAGATTNSNTTACNVTMRRTNGNADSDPVCVQTFGDLA